MNKSQRRSINKTIRYYRDVADDFTSVRATVEPTEYGVIWVTINTRRSDCSAYSQRAIWTRKHAFIMIGKRGAITVYQAESGIGQDQKNHVACMLDGKTHK